MGIFNTRLACYLEQLAKGDIVFFQESNTTDGFDNSVQVNLRNGQYERLLDNKKPLSNTIYSFWMDCNNGTLYCETCQFIGNLPGELDEKSVHDGNMALYYLFCISEKPIAEIIKKTLDDSRHIDETVAALSLKYLTYLLKSVNDTVPHTSEGIVDLHDVANMLCNIDISYELFKEEHANDSLDMETIKDELKSVADYKRDDVKKSLGFKMEYIRPSREDLETSKLQYNGTNDYKYVGSNDGKESVRRF